ncbi:MAG: insulinase family protein [Nitrococcus mobilis]|nr:insulinase family protein [Nitrococcus mobilis]
MTRTAIVMLLIGLLLCSSVHASDDDSAPRAEQWPVSEYRLDNGMRVIVREDHRAPVVVSQVWYRVGSSYERLGHTGISHLLEHMMFKGTAKHPPGELLRIIARNGGRQNAFTGRDFTVYFQQLAADRLEIAFRLEADRMQNLILDAQELAKERQVVMEERRMRVTDQPRSRFGEHFNTIAYPASPYAWPGLGWQADLEAITLEDLRGWYARWYAPGNALLVVVGDVQPEQVLRLAKAAFGKVPARATAHPHRADYLQAPGERRLVMHSEDAKVPYVLLGYQVPSVATAQARDEIYALMVLASILDGGKGARLSQELVRDQRVAASAGAGYNAVARLNSLFVLDAVPNNNTDNAIDPLVKALREQAQRLQSEPVDTETLERAKNLLLADHLYELDSMFYQAMQIGMLETAGVDWRILQVYPAKIRAVSAANVQAVARKYLIPSRLTVGILLPQTPPNDDVQPGNQEERS